MSEFGLISMEDKNVVMAMDDINRQDDTMTNTQTQTQTQPPSSSSSSSSSSVICNPLVLSILITETAERVAYFGFRAILVLYFTHGLQFSDSAAVSLCAATVALAYLSPLLGAVLADSVWGRFPTIWRFGWMYVAGLCLLTFAAYGVPNYYNNEITTSDNDEDTPPTQQQEESSSSSTEERSLSLERILTFAGLLLVCTGTGGIKPCVSAFGADQVVLEEEEEEEEDYNNVKKAEDPIIEGSSTTTGTNPSNREERIREFFNSFYFCINVGALGSFAIIPIVRANWGFGAAFLIPTLFMIVALFVFASQRHAYKQRKRDDSLPSLYDILQLCVVILKERFYGSTLGKFVATTLGFSPIMGTTLHVPVPSDEDCVPDETDDEEGNPDSRNAQVYQDAEQALHVLPLMLFFPVFWMLYDQQGSVWVLQATRLNLHGLEPEQLNVLNPLEIMVFIPLFDIQIYPWLERHGFNIQPLRRMEYGMFLAAVSFLTSAWLEHYIQTQPSLNSVSVAWQIPQITILTVAEILLNVTGLEFAYSQAPSNMQALILALYLFMTAIGDGFGAVLYASVFSYLSSVVAMLLCVLFMLVNLAFFSLVASRWKPYDRRRQRIHTNNEEEEGLELRHIIHLVENLH